jgi:hypothetical protein
VAELGENQLAGQVVVLTALINSKLRVKQLATLHAYTLAGFVNISLRYRRQVAGSIVQRPALHSKSVRLRFMVHQVVLG